MTVRAVPEVHTGLDFSSGLPDVLGVGLGAGLVRSRDVRAVDEPLASVEAVGDRVPDEPATRFFDAVVVPRARLFLAVAARLQRTSDVGFLAARVADSGEREAPGHFRPARLARIPTMQTTARATSGAVRNPATADSRLCWKVELSMIPPSGIEFATERLFNGGWWTGLGPYG